MRWTGVTWRCDGQDNTAIVEAATQFDRLVEGDLPAPGGVGARHLGHLVNEMHTDRRIVIRQVTGQRRVLFDGYPTTQTVRWSAKTPQVVTAQCRSRPDEDLQSGPTCQVFGRWMRRQPNVDASELEEPDLAHVEATPLHFNAGGRPNRLATPIRHHAAMPGAEAVDIDVYPFASDNDPEAEYWTTAQAICYLLYHYVRRVTSLGIGQCLLDLQPLQSATHNPAGLNTFTRRMTAKVGDLRLDAVSAATALGLVCQAQGLHWAYMLTGVAAAGDDDDEGEGEGSGGTAPDPVTTGDDYEYSLRIWPLGDPGDAAELHMGNPKSIDLPRSAPWSDVSAMTPKAIAQANVAHQATLTMDRRAISNPTILSGRKRYEVSLILRPGWIPFIEANQAEYYPLVPVGLSPGGGNVLDSVDIDDEENMALVGDWWSADLGRGGDSTPEDSVFHTSHEEHWRVAAVGRVLVFPMDARRGKRVGESVSKYNRELPPVGFEEGDPAYEPWLPGSPEDPESSGHNILSEPGDFGGLGASLAPAANWVPRMRLPGPCISQMKYAGTQGTYLRMTFDGGHSWHNIETLWTPLQNECGIRLNAPNLFELMRPGARFTGSIDDDSVMGAYIRRQFGIALTCTIEGDERLRENAMAPPFFRRRRAVVLDAGERFAYRDRQLGNSAMKDVPETDPTFGEVNDSDSLTEYGIEEARIGAHEIISGNPQIPWIESALAVGDELTGVEGIGLRFPRPAPIVSIAFSNAPGRTTLMLADTREDADVESEGRWS